MNVAIYLRKSREEDNETREETLARHERILLDYCNNLLYCLFVLFVFCINFLIFTNGLLI